MRKNNVAVLATVALSLVTLSLAATDAPAQRGRGGYGYHYGGGVYRGGYYRPYGYYPYGYRGFYPGIGIGIGIGGFYAPYYGSYAYPIAPGYGYTPYPAPGYAPGYVAGYPQGSQAAQQPAAPPANQKPPPDGSGHLQLIVPENAEVFIDGSKIAQTGAMREIVTPKLTPGTRYTYRITVRYADASGKMVDDTRAIRFQADDWFTIDFNHAAPPQANAPQPGVAPPPAPLQLQPTPSLSK